MLDYIQTIESITDEKAKKRVYSFLDKVDPQGYDDELRTVAFSVLLGQRQTEVNFDEFDANAKYSLREEQHPHWAAFSGSHSNGHERFIFGATNVGEVLMLRLPATELIQDEETLRRRGLDVSEMGLRDDVRATIALAQSKGIPFIPHVKNDDSLLLQIAYDYHKAGCDQPGAKLPKNLKDVSPDLIDYAKSRQALYQQVEVLKAKHGGTYAHFEKMGISFKGIRSERDKFKLAMAAQTLIEDVTGYELYKDAKPGLIPVLQVEANGKYYVFDKNKGSFIAVPSLDRCNKEKLSGFVQTYVETLRKSPEGRDSAVVEKEDKYLADLGHKLCRGYTLFKEWKRDQVKLGLCSKVVSFIKGAFSGCTDSRLIQQNIWGPSSTNGMDVVALRTPGNTLVDNEGNLTVEAKQYLSVAKLRGVPVIHSHHSNCGAMNAADLHLFAQIAGDPEGKAASLPVAFKELGDAHKSTYKTVWSKGKAKDPVQRSKEIVEAYRKETGVNVITLGDCLGLQQLMVDVAAAKKYPHGPSVYGAYHNTTEGQLYLINPAAKVGEPSFIEVPSVKKGMEHLLDVPAVKSAQLGCIRQEVRGVSAAKNNLDKG